MLLKTFAESAAEFRQWATDPRPRMGIGYSIFDSRTNGGAARGEVILFQARSQVGKTTFALNVVNNLGPDAVCVFASLEMNARYLVPRLAAIHTDSSTTEVENAFRNFGDHPAILQTVMDFPYFAVPDKPAMSLRDMTAVLDEATQRFGRRPDLLIIDFLELIGGAAALSTVDKIDMLTRRVKDLARDRDLVVLLLHQVGRGAGETGAVPLDITSSRYGGEVSADYVLSAFRPCLRAGITQDEFLRERSWYYLQFLKSRGGSELHPEGLLHRFDPDTMRITEWTPEQIGF